MNSADRATKGSVTLEMPREQNVQFSVFFLTPPTTAPMHAL